MEVHAFGLNAFGLSQVLIGIGLLFDLVSFQLRSRGRILICFICSCSLIGVHFVLLAQWTAALMTAIAAVRFAVSYFTIRRSWMYFFAAATCAGSALTYHAPINLLALASTLVANYGAFEPRDQRLRILMMISTAMWITHNAIVHTPAAVFVDSFFLASNFVGYYRYYIKPQRIDADDSTTAEETSPA